MAGEMPDLWLPLWPIVLYPAEGKRLNWPEGLDAYQDGVVYPERVSYLSTNHLYVPSLTTSMM